VQALAAVLGGTQSLHTNGYDEALALPTEQSARLALRTQQILGAESGVSETVDPLAGSWYVESLTDAIEAQARQYLDQVEERGGAARAIEWCQDEIHRSAYEYQLAIERGDRAVVGVNIHRVDEPAQPIPAPAFAELEREQRDRLAEFRARRAAGAVRAALNAVDSAAASGTNLVPVLVEAVRANATLGEISDVLRNRWGTWRGVAA
jgi:methylmalonyl-CoA mutase N-terminal domain/subunit